MIHPVSAARVLNILEGHPHCDAAKTGRVSFVTIGTFIRRKVPSEDVSTHDNPTDEMAALAPTALHERRTGVGATIGGVQRVSDSEAEVLLVRVINDHPGNRFPVLFLLGGIHPMRGRIYRQRMHVWLHPHVL